MIVDDDPDTRAVFVAVFEAEGYCVAQAPDGVGALAILQGDAPPDVLVLDLLLPQMDGWSLLARVRAEPNLRHIRVLVMSAVAHVRRDELANADFVASKPVDSATLFETVSKLCLPFAPRPSPSTGV